MCRLPIRLLAALLSLGFLAPQALAQRLAEEAAHGMVASASRHASEAGVEMLRKGGNAVDAAVATGLALAVTMPRAGNIGGGGFMLVRLADGHSVVIDYRETAPANARRDMYLDAGGNVIPKASTVGHLAAGIPGTVAGLSFALEKYGSGKISWADAVEPARRLAADGFALSPAHARNFTSHRALLGLFPESARIFLRNGNPWRPGELFQQPELAATLGRIQTEGPREFYEGETARLIVAEMERSGGLITLDDLSGYVPAEREPLRGSYREHEIITVPPPSSGGVVILQILGMIEPFDVAATGPNSAATVHLMAEAMRRAFYDRAELMGDTSSSGAFTATLLDPGYLRRRMADFDSDRATPSASVSAGAALPPPESEETTHFSVVDADGNVVSNTYTLNAAYGCGVTVAGAGFVLNNEMDDFTSKPGVPNYFGLIQGEVNAIQPGKRPLSSMSPTIVLKSGKPYLVVGSPGGPTIINTVLEVIVNVIDHRMNLAQAVEAPRFHHQWMPDALNYEPFGLSPDTMDLLRAKGHTLAIRSVYATQDPSTASRTLGDAECILIDPETGVLRGFTDPRSPDAAAVGF